MENSIGLIQNIEEQLNKINQHIELEKLFADESVRRFEKNVSVFKEFYPDIYKNITEFKSDENFKILVSECGHGNFIPKGLDVPLYSQNKLIEQVKEQVQRNLQRPKFSRVGLYKDKRKDNDDDRIHIRYMTELSSRIAELTADSKEPYLKDFGEHYPSFLCFGIGLGYHLDIILKDTTFDYLFLCEPDFELFYASLFCIDWAGLVNRVNESGASCFIILGIPYDMFFQKLIDLTANVGAFSLINSFCYQHYPSEEINNSIKVFFENFYQLQLGFGFYDDAVTGLAHSLRNARGDGHFLIPSKHKVQVNIPAFVVGNGPSLDESIELIRAHRDDAIIFAAGTALQSLLKAGIKPDFHVLVERPLAVYQVLTETTDMEDLSDLNLLSVEVVYPDTLQHYKWSGLGLKGPEASTVFFQSMQYFKSGKMIPSMGYAGPLVSNTAASFACQFGFKEVYLFGVDNGYPTDDKRSHSELSIYSDTKYAGRYKANPDAKYPLEGNLGEPVMATNLMIMSKLQLEALFSRFKGCEVYKVGSGAKLKNTKALTVDDVLILSAKSDKSGLVEEIKTSFFEKIEFSAADERYLAIDEYKELINYLIEIGDRPFSNRREAAEILKAQARVVYTYKSSRTPHLFHLIKGTLLYIHCPLITLLYSYQNEELTLVWFKECLAIWQRFLAEIREDYPKNWYSKCNYTLRV
jgi:hypothetical protein